MRVPLERGRFVRVPLAPPVLIEKDVVLLPALAEPVAHNRRIPKKMQSAPSTIWC